ncbi:MAG: hypothetical protein JWQ09_207 [Segetibacter sp.]|nr:hypothetical protein [Segetibacter sp.]
MISSFDSKLLEQFHKDFIGLKEFGKFMELLEFNYKIEKVELIPENIPNEDEIYFNPTIPKTILIENYRIERENILPFVTFRLDFIKKAEFLLKNLFTSNKHNSSEKVALLNKCKNLSIGLANYHDLTDIMMIVGRLGFTIETKEGLKEIFEFSPLSISDEIFNSLRNEFLTRYSYFKELTFLITRTLDLLNINISANPNPVDKNKLTKLRHLFMSSRPVFKNQAGCLLMTKKKLQLKTDYSTP